MMVCESLVGYYGGPMDLSPTWVSTASASLMLTELQGGLAFHVG